MVNSVMLQNIEALKSSLKENISYVDVRYNDIDENGSITVENGTAVINRFKIWLQSGSFDYHRNPELGGFMEKFVFKKPLTEDSCRQIEANLKAETYKYFPEITLTNVSVNCNLARRRWEIRVSVLDNKTGILDESMFSEDGSFIIYNFSQ